MAVRDILDRRVAQWTASQPPQGGGEEPLVDEMIGTSYETVRFVALNIEYVHHVSQNMQNVYVVAGDLDNVDAVAGAISQVEAVAAALPTFASLISLVPRAEAADAALKAAYAALQALIPVVDQLVDLQGKSLALLDLQSKSAALVDLHANQAALLDVYANLDEIVSGAASATQLAGRATALESAVAAVQAKNGTQDSAIAGLAARLTAVEGRPASFKVNDKASDANGAVTVYGTDVARSATDPTTLDQALTSQANAISTGLAGKADLVSGKLAPNQVPDLSATYATNAGLYDGAHISAALIPDLSATYVTVTSILSNGKFLPGLIPDLSGKYVTPGALFDGNGQILSDLLPAQAKAVFYPVNSQAAMLALTPTSNVAYAIRSDTQQTFAWNGNDPTQDANWVLLPSPGSPFTSINGQTSGAVVTRITDIVGSGAFGQSLLAAADLATVKTSLQLLAADITDAGSFGRRLLQTTSAGAAKMILAITVDDLSSWGAFGLNLAKAPTQTSARFLLGLNTYPAASVTVAGGTGLVAANVQDALSELHGADTSLSNRVTTLENKPAPNPLPPTDGTTAGKFLSNDGAFAEWDVPLKNAVTQADSTNFLIDPGVPPGFAWQAGTVSFLVPVVPSGGGNATIQTVYVGWPPGSTYDQIAANLNSNFQGIAGGGTPYVVATVENGNQLRLVSQGSYTVQLNYGAEGPIPVGLYGLPGFYADTDSHHVAVSQRGGPLIPLDTAMGLVDQKISALQATNRPEPIGNFARLRVSNAWVAQTADSTFTFHYGGVQHVAALHPSMTIEETCDVVNIAVNEPIFELIYQPDGTPLPFILIAARKLFDIVDGENDPSVIQNLGIAVPGDVPINPVVVTGSTGADWVSYKGAPLSTALFRLEHASTPVTLPNAGEIPANYAAADGVEAPPFPNFNWGANTYEFSGAGFDFSYNFPDGTPQQVSDGFNQVASSSGVADRFSSSVVAGPNGGQVIRIVSTVPFTSAITGGNTQQALAVGTFDAPGFAYDTSSDHVLVAPGQKLTDTLAGLGEQIAGAVASNGNQDTEISTLQGSVTQNTGDISTLKGHVDTLTSNQVNDEARITTNEADIASLKASRTADEAAIAAVQARSPGGVLIGKKALQTNQSLVNVLFSAVGEFIQVYAGATSTTYTVQATTDTVASVLAVLNGANTKLKAGLDARGCLWVQSTDGSPLTVSGSPLVFSLFGITDGPQVSAYLIYAAPFEADIRAKIKLAQELCPQTPKPVVVKIPNTIVDFSAILDLSYIRAPNLFIAGATTSVGNTTASTTISAVSANGSNDVGTSRWNVTFSNITVPAGTAVGDQMTVRLVPVGNPSLDWTCACGVGPVTAVTANSITVTLTSYQSLTGFTALPFTGANSVTGTFYLSKTQLRWPANMKGILAENADFGLTNLCLVSKGGSGAVSYPDYTTGLLVRGGSSRIRIGFLAALDFTSAGFVLQSESQVITGKFLTGTSEYVVSALVSSGGNTGLNMDFDTHLDGSGSLFWSLTGTAYEGMVISGTMQTPTEVIMGGIGSTAITAYRGGKIRFDSANYTIRGYSGRGAGAFQMKADVDSRIFVVVSNASNYQNISPTLNQFSNTNSAVLSG